MQFFQLEILLLHPSSSKSILKKIKPLLNIFGKSMAHLSSSCESKTSIDKIFSGENNLSFEYTYLTILN
jgi:antitoxin component HigA of HigAB toxin-antitoxin module